MFPGFFGFHEHSLDDKNRLVLPLALRKKLPDELLQQGFVLVAGTRNEFLVLYPMYEWDRVAEALNAKYDASDLVGQEYLTSLYASAHHVELDKQYRFVMPDASRRRAGIERDVCMVGRGNTVFVYAKERWEKREEAQPAEVALVAPAPSAPSASAASPRDPPRGGR
jgi:MraZ protein